MLPRRFQINKDDMTLYGVQMADGRCFIQDSDYGLLRRPIQSLEELYNILDITAEQLEWIDPD